MKTYLLRINDPIKAEVLAGFLREIDFVEEILPVSHWQDDDYKDDEMEEEVKENMIHRKNPAIAKHLLNED